MKMAAAADDGERRDGARARARAKERRGDAPARQMRARGARAGGARAGAKIGARAKMRACLWRGAARAMMRAMLTPWRAMRICFALARAAIDERR